MIDVERYKEQIRNVLAMRGVEPTEDNIRKVMQAQRKAPSAPGAGEQLLMGVGGALATGLGAYGGRALGGYLSSGLGGAGSTAAPAAAVAKPVAATAGMSIPGSLGAGSAGLGGTLGGIAAAAAPAAVLGAGAYGLYNEFNDAEGKSVGDAILDSAKKPSFYLNPVNYFLPGAGSILGSLFGSGKDPWQKQLREGVVRDSWQDAGILDDDFRLLGSNLDLELDGGFRFDDGRSIYEVIPGQEKLGMDNFTEAQAQGIGALNPLGVLTVGGDQGDLNGFDRDISKGMATGMAFNALNDDGSITNDELRNVYDTYASGLGLDSGHGLVAKLGEMYNQGQIGEDVFAYQNALNDIYGLEYYG